MNYNNKKFKVISNSENGELSSELVFHYKQDGNVLSCTYTDKDILKGHLLGWVDQGGKIEMNYHQINKAGILMTGQCTSTPELLANGKIRLHESWQWTSGDCTKGNSTLEEV
jgi:hypothetical protein